MAFATAGELEAYTGLTIVTAQAELLLDLATSAIQAHTRQTIYAVTNDTVTLAGNWSHDLNLPERPVTAVHSVAIDGQTLTTDDYTWQRRGKLWRPRGYSLATERTFDIGIYANWGGPDREVVVNYDHGYTAIPGWIKGICLEAAKRVAVNPGGYTAESIDGYSRAHGRSEATPGVSLEASEMARLDQLTKTTRTGRVQS